MKFIKTKIDGAFIIELDKFEDHRGFFLNTWNSKEFQEKNLDVEVNECNVAFNYKQGTVRGFHYQVHPFEGSKLVRCTKGKILDFTLDLRPNSETFKEWISVELSEENLVMNYIPKGCAHGYQTLRDDSEVLYLMSQIYMPKYERGVRFTDPAFSIDLPLEISEISEKDKLWPNFE